MQPLPGEARGDHECLYLVLCLASSSLFDSYPTLHLYHIEYTDSTRLEDISYTAQEKTYTHKP